MLNVCRGPEAFRRLAIPFVEQRIERFENERFVGLFEILSIAGDPRGN